MPNFPPPTKPTSTPLSGTGESSNSATATLQPPPIHLEGTGASTNNPSANLTTAIPLVGHAAGAKPPIPPPPTPRQNAIYKALETKCLEAFAAGKRVLSARDLYPILRDSADLFRILCDLAIDAKKEEVKKEEVEDAAKRFQQEHPGLMRTRTPKSPG